MNNTPELVQTAGIEPSGNSGKLKYSRHGLTIVRRSEKAGSKFTTRIRFQGQCHQLTLCDTVEESFKAAVLARREIHAGRWAAYKENSGLRSPERFATLEEIKTAYLAFPGGDKGIKLQTKQRNLQALERFMRAANAASVTALTAATLSAWKWQKRELSSAQTDAESQSRVLRSAQSELLQARSVFSPEALSYYRERCKLNLPDTLKKFCEEPGFNNISKDEYHAPSDDIIAKTFAAIEQLILADGKPVAVEAVPTDPRNVFVAFWLAIGFGLRASEMAQAQLKDFQLVGGDVFFRPEWRPKNKKTCDIGVQLDAWSRLEPFLQGAPEAYALAGTMTERSTDVFRRISTLFQGLGWQTTHQIHEMRAWAGCQLAMHHPQGLLAAQAFLRHGSYNTTQQYYGHHIKVRLDKVALRIPALSVPAPVPAVPVYVAPAETNRLHFAN